MTATALAYDPALDFFDDTDFIAPARPQLRLIEGQGYAHVVPPAVPRPPVEVIRRRRFLALFAVTIAVLMLSQVLGFSLLSFGATGAVADQAPAVHVVLPGDTYGAIAADLGVANPASAARQLRAANGGSDLVVGQRLVVDLAALTSGA